MNSIIDLNTAANITFNNQSAYAIAFGNSLGNITANIDNFTTNGVTKQVSITTLTDPVRDVLVDWQFSNVGVVTMAYAGPYANISLNQIAPATWRAYGIRSINQYDEAMANVKYTDITGGLAPNPDYNYLTVINDQEGNTRNWLTTLNVIANPTISITGNVQYAEDTLANVTIANIVVDPASTAVFRLFANVSAANGEVSNGVVTANSVSIDGTANSLNSQLAAAAIKFLPASDLTSNVANAINFNLVRSGNSVNTANANITCVATHNEYSLTTSYNYAEDQTVPMTFAITDLDTHATGYTVTFTQTSGATAGFFVNGGLGSYGVPAVVSGTKANINVANISFLPFSDDTGNIGLAYTQVKHLPTGNVTQASNVAISLINTSSHSDYSLTTSYTFAEDTQANLVYSITDTDIRANSYTVTWTQTSGTSGQLLVNGVAQGVGNAAVVTGSKATLNAANVVFVPYPDSTGNVGLTYSQSKVNVWGNTVTQASNIAVTANCTSTHAEYSWTGGTYNEDTPLNFGDIIQDQDARASTYTITITQTAGNVGTWLVANANQGFSNTAFVTTTTKSLINGQIAWQPPIDYTGNVSFTLSQSKYNTLFGNITQATNVSASWSIANTNPEISNMIDRTYTSNTVNYIFATSTPYINDGADRGQTYTITLNSSLGRFGNSAANAVLANTYTYTGNMTQVNGQFMDMVFVPTAYVPASTGTYTYTQVRDGVNQANITANLTGTTQAFYSPHTFLADGTYSPSFEEKYFGSNTRVIVVGAGGGGGRRVSAPFFGGGGAGGEVKDQTLALQTASFYAIQIGTGGSGASGNSFGQGSSGGLSRWAAGSLSPITANGGGGAPAAQSGGNNIVYIGGTSTSNATVGYGGGGAGGGGNGANAVFATSSGTGGIGYTAVLPTGNLVVAVGGGGSGADGTGTTNGQPGSGGRGGNAVNSAQAGKNGAVYVIVT